MFFRQIYDDKLAQAAYLIGCQRTGEAIVVDPERDVDRYIDLARRKGFRVTAVAETHIHADFLSGARELAEQTGACVYVSDEGDADWKYQWLDKKTGGGAYPHVLLHDGDHFSIGQIEFRVVHTPGHTPEHICFLVIDRGGGASEPMGILTGDFVFVGDVGRPDLLETAAGQAGTSQPAARRLYQSLQKFAALPDFVQVWPAHGAGSACGKALGAVPQSTAGYEKRFNAAMRAATDESAFVRAILADQPEPPLYFGRMKRENKLGPAVLGRLPKPRELSAADLATLTREGGNRVVIDSRPWPAFRGGHLRGALFVGQDGTFPTVAGSYVSPESEIVLILPAERVDEAVRDLVRIGLDRVVAFATPDTLARVASEGGSLVSTPEIDSSAAHERLESKQAVVLDVRSAAEFAGGHIPGASNIPYPHLPLHVAGLPRDRMLIVNCRSGGRSARAAAYLQRAGFDVANLAGGFSAWEQAGLPVNQPSAVAHEKPAR